MLTRAENRGRNITESQNDSQGNSLATEIEHSPDYVQLYAKVITKMKGGETELWLISHTQNQKGKEKGPITKATV